MEELDEKKKKISCVSPAGEARPPGEEPNWPRI